MLSISAIPIVRSYSTRYLKSFSIRSIENRGSLTSLRRGEQWRAFTSSLVCASSVRSRSEMLIEPLCQQPARRESSRGASSAHHASSRPPRGIQPGRSSRVPSVGRARNLTPGRFVFWRVRNRRRVSKTRTQCPPPTRLAAGGFDYRYRVPRRVIEDSIVPAGYRRPGARGTSASRSSCLVRAR